jgi:hypothetical protein
MGGPSLEELLKQAKRAKAKPKAKPRKRRRRRVRPKKIAKPVKPEVITLSQVSRVMSGQLTAKKKLTPAQLKTQIESIAKNRKSLKDLVGKNPAKTAELIFKAMAGVEKFAGEYGYLQYKIAPKYPKLLPEKPFKELSPKQKLFAIRSYLLETIPAGNAAFRKELELIYGKGNIPEIQESLEHKINPELLLAASAYLRRHYAEQAKKGTGTKIPVLKIEPLKVIKAPKGAAKPAKATPAKPTLTKEEKEVVDQAQKLVTLATTHKPLDLLRTLNKMEDEFEPTKYKKVLKVTLQNLFNRTKKLPKTGFVAFLVPFNKYKSLTAGELAKQITDPQVGLATLSILDFLNWRSNVGSWKLDKFKWDVSTLNQELDRGKDIKFKLDKNDLKGAITGISVYYWRLANPNAKSNAWTTRTPTDKTPRRLIR